MRALLLAVAACALLATTPLLAHQAKGSAKTVGKHRDAPSSFAAQPPKGTWAKCAVSGDLFQIDEETQFSKHQGRVYAFCCPDCKPDFDKAPGKYANK